MLHEGKVVPVLNEAPPREDIRRNGAIAVRIPDFGIDTIPADPPSRGRKSGNFRKGPQERSKRCGGQKNSLSVPGIEFQFLSCPTRSNCIDWFIAIAYRCVKHISVSSLILIQRKIFILQIDSLFYFHNRTKHALVSYIWTVRTGSSVVFVSTHVSVSLKLEVYFVINQHGEFVNARTTTFRWRHNLLLAKPHKFETRKLRLTEQNGAVLQECLGFHFLCNKFVSAPVTWSVSLWTFNYTLPIA